MASEAQIRANRENAQKSCGPKTEAGRAASSQNAATHRMFAYNPVAGPEDEREYQTLLECLRDQYLPQTDIEMDCIFMMADARWRYLRACQEERALYNLDFKKHGAAEPASYDRAEALIRLMEGKHLQYSRRCQSMFDRKYQKALAELRRLQAERRRPEPEPEINDPLDMTQEQMQAYLAAKQAHYEAEGLLTPSSRNQSLAGEIGFISANPGMQPNSSNRR